MLHDATLWLDLLSREQTRRRVAPDGFGASSCGLAGGPDYDEYSRIDIRAEVDHE